VGLDAAGVDAARLDAAASAEKRDAAAEAEIVSVDAGSVPVTAAADGAPAAALAAPVPAVLVRVADDVPPAPPVSVFRLAGAVALGFEAAGFDAAGLDAAGFLGEAAGFAAAGSESLPAESTDVAGATLASSTTSSARSAPDSDVISTAGSDSAVVGFVRGLVFLVGVTAGLLSRPDDVRADDRTEVPARRVVRLPDRHYPPGSVSDRLTWARRRWLA
jgi:hypothetical protein